VEHCHSHSFPRRRLRLIRPHVLGKVLCRVRAIARIDPVPRDIVLADEVERVLAVSSEDGAVGACDCRATDLRGRLPYELGEMPGGRGVAGGGVVVGR
jgi:hypothetical protein